MRMIRIPSAVAIALIVPLAASQAASGRYACKAGPYAVGFDFGQRTLTLDGQTAAMTAGAATWRASVGGHAVIVVPSAKPGARIFDIIIDGGSGYSGFVVCKAA